MCISVSSGGVSSQRAWQRANLRDPPSPLRARSSQHRPWRGEAGARRSLAAVRTPARRGSSSPRAGLPSVPPRGRGSAKLGAPGAGEPGRRVEPEQSGGGQSRRAGGGAPKGEKESAAESKRLIGGRLAGSGSPGSALARLTERSSAERPCTHSHRFAAPALLPQKGESLAVLKARRNHLPTEISGWKDS